VAVTTSNLIQGPADLYTAPFGTAEPLDSAVGTAPDADDWVDVGGTDGGVKLEVDQKFTALTVDQIADRAGSRMTEREWVVSTNLAEGTLANLKIALNGGTVTTGTGNAVYEPVSGAAAMNPDYLAVLFDGAAPGGFPRRVIVRKVLQTAKTNLAYQKDKQTFIPVEFTGHYVSTSIAPLHIADQTA
jgi:hypothetical protein